MKYSKELHDKLRNRTGLHIFNHQIGLDSEDIDALLDEIERLREQTIDYENDMFLGQPIEYWMRIKAQLDADNSDHWVREILLLKLEIERLQAERRWIPVSERLPERKGEYLAVIEGTRDQYCDVSIWVEPIEFYSECGHWGCGINRFVTHWMSLPEPPEEK